MDWRGWQVDRGNFFLQSSVIHTELSVRIRCVWDFYSLHFKLLILGKGPLTCATIFFLVNLRTCLWGSSKLCTAHLELFNHQHCAKGHQYSSTLTEPTRWFHTDKTMCCFQLQSVSRFSTQNIQDACSGAALLRAQGSPTQCSCYGAPRGFAAEFI